MIIGSSLLKAALFTIVFFSISSCGGCGDCMICDDKEKVYFEMTGEVTCPDCGGDGCRSNGKN